MPSRRLFLGLPLVMAAAAARAQPATPPIFAAGAVKHAVEEVLAPLGAGAPAAAFDTVGALRDRILGGERPQFTLLSAEAIAALSARGLVPADGVVEIGRTGVALGAPAGRPVPDIATPEAFRAALLAAESIAYADPARGATAGRHVAAVIARLGLTEALAPKLRLVRFGVEGVEMASRGEVALAFSQATEIIDRPGVQLVGLLPDALQLWTIYRAAVVQDGPEARRLLALFGTEAGRAAFARIGFRPG
ncbi:molybdate ABC transporter substrate-binding protein [Falsiroseomonas tokyonensis]|uniref:Molybdate ABC transporter substrate-binding protein n=1 Tax=Falsiroseomonas tokyonensis TaxID=430521 RepID=A0ABV7C0T6_9PROT|nr:substrate-binding domain-containing protein [Falsiroseomonas tokyonensis]MBU8540075.1 substrate-binding domain-containing protein [Falsiroseomonas tokyonensis]